MTQGIKIATTEISDANKDEIVVDSTAQGSWKIAKRVNINYPITYASGTATQLVVLEAHGLGFTPAFIAMIETNIDGTLTLYNIPAFQSSFSAKVYVDGTNVYTSVVSGIVGTSQCNFRILLLGEKIE